MEAMDWSHLHTLSIASPSNATLTALRGSTLPALKNLEIKNDWRLEADIVSFLISTAQPLESLSINGISPDIGDTVLSALEANISQT